MSKLNFFPDSDGDYAEPLTFVTLSKKIIFL